MVEKHINAAVGLLDKIMGDGYCSHAWDDALEAKAHLEAARLTLGTDKTLKVVKKGGKSDDD
jgi:hypothetical protein